MHSGKLVRDNIPNLMQAQQHFSISQVSGDELVHALRAKLLEEAMKLSARKRRPTTRRAL